MHHLDVFLSFEYDCIWIGNSRWVHAMQWPGKEEFVASPKVPFLVDGSEAGLLKRHGPLSFLKVPLSHIFMSSTF